MSITREQPVRKNPQADDDDELDGLYEPVTEAPKPTKREILLQRKREKTGLRFMQLVGYGLGMLGRYTPLPILPEDVAAVHVHARPIAKAAADVASEDEKFAAVLDRLGDFGPYGALIEAATGLGMQMVANRKARNNPELALRMGAIPPEQLMAMFTQQQEAELAEATASMNGDGA